MKIIPKKRVSDHFMLPSNETFSEVGVKWAPWTGCRTQLCPIMPGRADGLSRSWFFDIGRAEKRAERKIEVGSPASWGEFR